MSALVLVQILQGQTALAQTTTIDVAEPVVVTQPEEVYVPTVQEVLLKVCEANGYSQECAKTLLGMLWIESSNISDVVGDHGAALGYFQIHYKLHNISADCATDLVCSTNWTIGYLNKHSYPTYVSYAVQCHNSCNVANGYAARALRNGERLWEEPMTITQSQPIVLPTPAASAT